MPRPAKLIPVVRWERAEPWLTAALAYDARNISIDTVKADFLAGRYFLLDGIASAGLCEIVTKDCRRQAIASPLLA